MWAHITLYVDQVWEGKIRRFLFKLKIKLCRNALSLGPWIARKKNPQNISFCVPPWDDAPGCCISTYVHTLDRMHRMLAFYPLLVSPHIPVSLLFSAHWSYPNDLYWTDEQTINHTTCWWCVPCTKYAVAGFETLWHRTYEYLRSRRILRLSAEWCTHADELF